MNHTRFLAVIALGAAILMAPASNAGAAPLSPAGLSRSDSLSAIVLVQEKKKSETVRQKVRRVWRNLTGYKFDVACPAFALALSRTSCTETGKNREDARAKCQAQHALCQVGDANR